MKKILIAMTAVALLTGSVVYAANTDDTNTLRTMYNGSQVREEHLGEKTSLLMNGGEGRRDLGENREDALENIQKRAAAMEKLFEMYYPEALDTYTDLVDEHVAFHTDQKEIVESKKDEMIDVFLNSLDEDETLSVASIRVALTELREENQTKLESVKDIMADKLSELTAEKEVNETIMSSLKSLLAEETIDETAVQEVIDDVISQLEKHIDIDKTYAEKIENAIGSLE